jgi:hypothetical protein
VLWVDRADDCLLGSVSLKEFGGQVVALSSNHTGELNLGNQLSTRQIIQVEARGPVSSGPYNPLQP